MKRLAIFIAVCFLGISFASAQSSLPKTQFTQAEKNGDADDDYGDEYEEGEIYFDLGMNLPGDQYIKIALGVNLPLNFPDLPSVFKGESQLKIGGIGTLGYHYFMTEKISLGVDLGFGFNISIGSHSFNTVPVVFTATYEPNLGKFTFPLTLGLGVAWESFNSKNYFPGLVLRPQVGCHYRLMESWTIGLETSYLFLPQFNAIHDSSAKNRFGNFWTIDVVARYMF